jgi:hypothetical protein
MTMTDHFATTVWKLGIVAALATCYLATAWVIRRTLTPAPVAEVAPPAPSPPPTAPPRVTSPPARTTMRPAIRPAPTTPRIVRAPARRRVRIRTRSS